MLVVVIVCIGVGELIQDDNVILLKTLISISDIRYSTLSFIYTNEFNEENDYIII